MEEMLLVRKAFVSSRETLESRVNQQDNQCDCSISPQSSILRVKNCMLPLGWPPSGLMGEPQRNGLIHCSHVSIPNNFFLAKNKLVRATNTINSGFWPCLAAWFSGTRAVA